MYTETSAAFATDEDTFTYDPLIKVEKIAGNDPCELAAITLSKASNTAASTTSIPGKVLAGRLKVPNDKIKGVFADISVPNTNSISEEVKGLTREDNIILVTPCDGKIADVKGVDGRPTKGLPERVMISLAPEGTSTAGCSAIVIVTPVSDAVYRDSVICNELRYGKIKICSCLGGWQHTRGRFKPRLSS